MDRLMSVSKISCAWFSSTFLISFFSRWWYLVAVDLLVHMFVGILFDRGRK